MLVRNVKGHYKEPGMSWLDWWHENAPEGLEATECQCHDCHQTENLVGAHVYFDGYPETKYVVPLCKTHNNYYQERVLIDNPKFLVKVADELLVPEE